MKSSFFALFSRLASAAAFLALAPAAALARGVDPLRVRRPPTETNWRRVQSSMGARAVDL